MKTSEIILILLACVLVLAGIFCFAPPAAEKANLKEELRKAQEQVEILKKEVQEAEAQIEKLRNGDRATIEAVARDKFGLAKEGEVIYQIPRQVDESRPQK